MNRFMLAVTAVITALVIAPAGAQKPTSAQALLEAARQKETLEGDLTTAIKQYQAIVNSFGKTDRITAATALVRMAECYQKLGDAQAQHIYERVVREYADQKEVVALARAHLGPAVNAGSASGTTLRKLWAGRKADPEGAVFPDGSAVSYPHWDTGDLAVHDFATGTDRLLTNTGGWSQSEEFAEESAVSKDGKYIAYAWFDGRDRYQVRVIDAQAAGFPKPRRLFDNEDIVWIGPYDWSADGKRIAVQLRRKDGSAQIGWLGVDDGVLHVLKSVDWRGATKLAFSPDGRSLAFDLPVEDTEGQRDVFLIAVDGSREVPAVVSPGRDTVMGWSPDGRWLLFSSDRGAATGLWALPVANGKPAGPPELIKSDIGQFSLGVTARGNLYVFAAVGGRDVYVASVDFLAGKLTAPTRPVTSFVGFNDLPDWSPDGKFLAYVSFRNSLGRTRALGIHSLETGQLVRELQPRLTYFQNPQWAPDSQSLIATATDLKGRSGIYRIDAHTGESTAIALRTAPNGNLAGPTWSPDQKKIYYRKSTVDADRTTQAIVERDVASGAEREIIQREDLNTPALSPDGRFIATRSNNRGTKSSAVLLVPTGGGAVKELLRIGAPQWFGFMTFTRDGRNLLVRKALTDSGDRDELVMIPVDGGEPRTLEVPVSPFSGPIRIHPDGRKVAFGAGRSEGEVWVLENFLRRP